jgi:hypothetical protein
MPKAKMQFVATFTDKPRLFTNDSAQRDRTCGSVVEIVLSTKKEEAADAAQLLPIDQPEYRVEQMFLLADIFAAIFEQCQTEYKRAIAINAGDGLPSKNENRQR